MARPDGRAAPRAPRARPRRPPTGSRTASSPTTSRTRCCRRTAGSSSTGSWPRSADLGIAWDGDADRCFFIDDSGDVRRRRLPHRAARPSGPREGARRDDPLRRPRQPRRPRHGHGELGGTSHVNRVGHAFFKIAMREHDAAFGGEVSGHYYFRDFWCADSGTIPALLVLELLSTQERHAVGARRVDCASATSSPARSTPRSPTSEAKMKEIAERSRRRRGRAGSTASRSTTPTGTSTCARRTPSRCCASTSSRSSRARTWSESATRCSTLIR